VIKIDRSFMTHVPDDAQAVAVIDAIFALADSCRCDVVAEGVETRQQLRELLEVGCDFGQGFLFSKPLPPEELNGILSSSGARVGNFQTDVDRRAELVAIESRGIKDLPQSGRGGDRAAPRFG
jgi:predicted signal transduction protein with EAL and GGDEF domain